MFARSSWVYRFAAGPSRARVQTRTLYVSSRNTRGTKRVDASFRREDQRLRIKLAELDKKEREVKNFLAAKADELEKQRSSSSQPLDLREPATAEEISVLDRALAVDRMAPLQTSARLKGPYDIRKPLKAQIPASIAANMRFKVDGEISLRLNLLGHEEQWGVLIREVHAQNALSGIPSSDVERLLSMMPLEVRARSAFKLEEAIKNAGLKCSQFIRDSLMAGYAHLAVVKDVERLLSESESPTEFSFGHLAKAYFKTNQFSEVTRILDRMKHAGVRPSLPIYTTVLQAFIQNKEYHGAMALFDNLKYLSSDTQPDTKTYNSVMLAAAKTHNVHKVLDLYNEMTSRAINPLMANQETLNILIYACSRDEKTHLKAWEFFIQIKDSGFPVGKETINALLYLCGSTGELQLARAIVKQQCQSRRTYPDDFAINCLFLAYVNAKPGGFSQVLGTAIGSKVRSQLMLQQTQVGDETMPPFLPLNVLDAAMILAESKAILSYFAETNAQVLSVQSPSSSVFGRSPVVFNYLKIALAHGTREEFVDRYASMTFRTKSPETSSAPVTAEIVYDDSPKHIAAIVRDKDVYQLAARAAIKFSDHDFAREVWTERGAWRRTSDFRNMSKKVRDQSDSLFARSMVELLAKTGDIDGAMQLVYSSVELIRWRRRHLQPLLDICAEREDFDSIIKIKSLLTAYFRKESVLSQHAS